MGRRKFVKQFAGHSKIVANEICLLNKLIAEGAPQRGSYVPSLSTIANCGTSFAAAKKFDDLPISQNSKAALKAANYVTLTAVQRAAIPHALCGRDVLGAAKTGSGKTLAFLVPILEALYRLNWNKLDGLGALIITPTRELALQIFEHLRLIGRKHDFSAGLLIGGNNLKEEQGRVNGMNILVATPGRLLQHMDTTPAFDVSNLQVLVLDEADRLLDMGFATTLNAVLEHLPEQRQTMLFSATQTKSVKDLARCRLKDPERVSVHEEAVAPTPAKLQQAYMVMALGDKMNMLWSFIKSHPKAKIIVFLSTCKQVKCVYTAFRSLRPGIPLRCLHGNMKQGKRMGVFFDYCNAKSMVLFATDIAARGLDFPSVDWVVQVDCPEDVAAYIHRVGRTARYISGGKAVMFLLPSETGLVSQLQQANVPLKCIKCNPNKVQPVTPALCALMAKNSELKALGQRAVTTYLRSVFLQPNKAVFDVTKMDAAEYAASLGLTTMPQIKFVKGDKPHSSSAGAGAGIVVQQQPPSGDAVEGSGVGRKRVRFEAGEGRDDDGDDVIDGDDWVGCGDGIDLRYGGSNVGGDGDDDLLVVKQHDVYNAQEQVPEVDDTKAKKRKKQRLKISACGVSGQRVVFDEEGAPQDPLGLLAQSLGRGEGGAAGEEVGTSDDDGMYTGEHNNVSDRFRVAQRLMRQRDQQDRQAHKQKRKESKLNKKAKQKAAAGDRSAGATLLHPREEESGSDDDDGEDGGGGYDSGSENEEVEVALPGGSAGLRRDGNDMACRDGKAGAGGVKVGNMQVKQQEQLVLQLVANRRKQMG